MHSGPPVERRRAYRLDTLGQLSAAITHEYNNVLGIILSSVEMMRDDDITATDRHAHLDRILRAANRARDFTQRLAVFGRAGAVPGDAIDCDVVIGEVVAPLIAACATDGIEIRQSLAASPHRLLIDRARLAMVLQAVIANAREAVATGGRIDVATRIADDEGRRWIEVSVTDSGPGIPVDPIERIFDPFFSTRPRALGLGLAAVDAVATAAGGSVRAANVPGARLTISLPAH
jgi:signal transduction histidine kinase